MPSSSEVYTVRYILYVMFKVWSGNLKQKNSVYTHKQK